MGQWHARYSDNTLPMKIDVPALLHAVARDGAASVPLMNVEALRPLVAEARACQYLQQEEYAKSGVREQLSTAQDLPADGHCARIAKLIEQTLEHGARAMPAYPFATPLRLDELVIQRYTAGSLGISPHRDFSSRINLVCVLVLEGHGRFVLCDDRAGGNARPVRGEPGDLILMRAPGFLNSDVRPLHFLDRIESERFALGMRNTK
jgi:hypothetical protein